MAQAVTREIKRFAEKSFTVVRDEILQAQTKKTSQILGRVRLSGNSRGHLPALIECEKLLMSKLIVAWARVYADTFTLYGLPADTELDQKFKTFAQQTAGGSISGIRGQLRLRSMRLRRPADGDGAPGTLKSKELWNQQ